MQNSVYAALYPRPQDHAHPVRRTAGGFRRHHLDVLDTLINIVVSVLLMVGLQLLVRKTKIGKAMQATSEDTGAAKLMGINTNSVVGLHLCHRLRPGGGGRHSVLQLLPAD